MPSVPSAASTAEHVAVRDDHRLADVERAMRGEQREAAARCRRGRAPIGARRPSAPDGTVISGATSAAPRCGGRRLRRCGAMPDKQMIVAAAKGAA